MSTKRTAVLLVFYGIYLVVFALLSFSSLGDAGMMGLGMGLGLGAAAYGIAWGLTKQMPWAIAAGLVHSVGLTIVFAWQGAAHFNAVLHHLQEGTAVDPKVSAAFLLICGLFVMALITSTIQVMLLRSNVQENR